MLAYFLTLEGAGRGAPPAASWRPRTRCPAAETGRLLGLLGPAYPLIEAEPGAALGGSWPPGQGAHAEVWTILRHFLAAFPPREGERARRPHTDAVLLAIYVAMRTDARAQTPEVAA